MWSSQSILNPHLVPLEWNHKKNKSNSKDPTVAGGKKVASSPKKAPSTPSRHHKASDPEH